MLSRMAHARARARVLNVDGSTLLRSSSCRSSSRLPDFLHHLKSLAFAFEDQRLEQNDQMLNEHQQQLEQQELHESVMQTQDVLAYRGYTVAKDGAHHDVPFCRRLCRQFQGRGR